VSQILNRVEKTINRIKKTDERRLQYQLFLIRMATSLFAVGLTLLVGAVFIVLAGSNPFTAYYWMYQGSLGGVSIMVETLVRSTPILLVSQGLAVAFTAKLWNIGAEGQLYMGGMLASIAAIMLQGLPGYSAIPVILLLAGLAGAFWALIPALLKAYYEINEVFTTLMLNYVALYIVSYLLLGPFRDPVSQFPETQTISKELWLPIMLQGTRLHAGVLLTVFIATPVVYFILKKTVFGMRLAILGANPEAARYSGINIVKEIVLGLVFSGFLAGVAGGVEVLGIQHKMRMEISPGYGYTGIAVALLGYLNPFGILLASLFMGGVMNGSTTMHRMARIPVGMAYLIQSLAILFIMVGYLIQERLAARLFERLEEHRPA